MKKWLLVIAAVLLAGCSSTENKTYYQLPQLTQPAMQAVSQSGTHQLWVEQVTIPDYLAGSGVVYQTSDVRYITAANNLWASPLDQQLLSTLVTNLSSALPGWLVASQPLGNDQDTLSVNITGFHGRYDGKVVVSGEWLLNRGGQLTKRPFVVELKQSADGYDAMVKTLGQAWQQEASNIASALR